MESNQGDQGCIFCQIGKGAVDSKKIYEDDKLLAVLDIYPANKGHMLVIPKNHYSLMTQIPEDEIGHIFIVVKKLSNVILKGLDCEGTNVYVANGTLAGQKAPHVMVHIIPRYSDDGLNFNTPKGESVEGSLDKLRASLVPLVKEVFSISEKDISNFYPGYRAGDSSSGGVGKGAIPENHDNGDQSDTPDLDKIGKMFK